MAGEDVVQQRIRLMVGHAGMVPMRNNVGACQDETGRLIRYGLMNDSKDLNEQFKSSDLIIPRPLLITQEWVGHTVAVFTAIECKADNWTMRITDERTQAQMRFHELIRNAGGFAGFAQSNHDARRILRLPE